MGLIVFQHEASEHAAVLGRVLQEHGHRLRTIKLFEGEPVPADLDGVDGIVSMGGAANVSESHLYKWIPAELAYIKKAHESGKPVVGVCLGAQLIAAALGGEVSAMARPEVGWANVKMAFAGTVDPLLAGIPWDTTQFHLHGQQVAKLPPDAAPLAGSAACRNQAFRVGLTTYGFQYHFECDRPQIGELAGDWLVTVAGDVPDRIRGETDKHYDSYRRLGDRLAANIAMLLFPLDKR